MRRPGTIAVAMALVLAGCGGSLSELRTEVVSLDPVSTAAVLGGESEQFGVCVGLERRGGGGSPMWAEFLNFRRRYTSPVLTGHEVNVQRGQSCHLRSIEQYQAAVLFDVSSISGRVVSEAKLTFTSTRDTGSLPPPPGDHRIGCSGTEVRSAVGTWSPGLFPSRLSPPSSEPGPFRGLIPWGQRRSGVRYPPAGAVEVDVSSHVRAWIRGVTNRGFLVMTDPDRLERTKERITEDDHEILCPLVLENFHLDVSVVVGS